MTAQTPIVQRLAMERQKRGKSDQISVRVLPSLKLDYETAMDRMMGGPQGLSEGDIGGAAIILFLAATESDRVQAALRSRVYPAQVVSPGVAAGDAAGAVVAAQQQTRSNRRQIERPAG